MKRHTTTYLLAALLSCGNSLQSAETPEISAPVKDHEWLQQLAGEWETETEVFMEPGKPPMKGKGTESTRMLGSFWVVGDGKTTMTGLPGTMTSLLTIGYDPQKKKYVGTWIDSMTSYLWKYEGAVDGTGKILTLETEGPSPIKSGQLSKFKEAIEIKSKDQRVFTSSIQGDDGKWTTIVTVHSRRK